MASVSRRSKFREGTGDLPRTAATEKRRFTRMYELKQGYINDSKISWTGASTSGHSRMRLKSYSFIIIGPVHV